MDSLKSRNSDSVIMSTNSQTTAKIKLSGKIVDAEVVKLNHLTIWVRTPDGNVIKRHRRKHMVR